MAPIRLEPYSVKDEKKIYDWEYEERIRATAKRILFDNRVTLPYGNSLNSLDILEKEIKRNVIIFKKCQGKRSLVSRLRRYAVYYRLFFTYNLTTREICDLLFIKNETSVQHGIGIIFKELCLKNKCVFHKILRTKT